jgi:hypothetical protein
MHITYRKIVGEQMSPAPPLLSRLMYSARPQNREVYYLLFDCIALQIPDAPYSGMLASFRLGLDCATPIRVSIGLSIAEPSGGQAGPIRYYLRRFLGSEQVRRLSRTECAFHVARLGWYILEPMVHMCSNRIVQRPVLDARGT